MSDEHTNLYWEVVVTGAGTTTTGQYVMGEPWIALAAGQSAMVTHVGRWSTPPVGGSPGVVDATYPGPLTPTSGGYRHGSMLNPRGGGTLVIPSGSNTELLSRNRLGYDDRPGDIFDPAPGVGLVPYFDSALYLPINDPGGTGAVAVSAGDVLVSTVSNPDQPCDNCPLSGGWTSIYSFFNGDPCIEPNPAQVYQAFCSTCPTKWAAALSILDAPPPTGAFRKPVSMPSPAERLLLPHLTTSSIDWAQLPRLEWPTPPNPGPDPVFGSFPTAEIVAPMFAGVWLDHASGEAAETTVNPTMHIPGYGQETKRTIGTAACLMALNPDGLAAGTVSASPPANPFFHDLAYGLIQSGIDVYGLMLDPTHSFEGVGGKVGGRKFLVAFANKMFGANAWPGMDGYFGLLPPNGPPRWTVWRTIDGVVKPYVRFQEDQQFYRAANPTESNPNLRADWDWGGSPWKWCATAEGDGRAYQDVDPLEWVANAGNTSLPPEVQALWQAIVSLEGPEAKRPASSASYAPIAIALRLLEMEPLWENVGLPEALGEAVSNEPLHAMFGYMDRWMVPSNAYAAAVYPVGNLDSRMVNEFNPNNGFKNFPTLGMEVWNKHRPKTQASPAIEILPGDFTFDTDVSGCSPVRMPTMTCQFIPRANEPILVEMYASETFTPPTAWASVIMTSGPMPGGWSFSFNSVNSVLVYLDPATLVSDFRQTNQYGYLGEVLPIPNAPLGTQFAVQALFADLGGSSCVAASNAIVLEVKQ